jgi:hypothetical protein
MGQVMAPGISQNRIPHSAAPGYLDQLTILQGLTAGLIGGGGPFGTSLSDPLQHRKLPFDERLLHAVPSTGQ